MRVSFAGFLNRALARSLTDGGGRSFVVIFAVVVIMMVVHLVIGASRVDQFVLLHCLLHFLVRVDLGQSLLVDHFARFLLLHHAKNTVVQMLVEILRVAECNRASRALASGIAAGLGMALIASTGLLPAVGWGLLHAMHGGQMTLEDIGSVEALFSR